MSEELQLFVFSLPFMAFFTVVGIALLISLRVLSIVALEVFYMMGGIR